MRLRINDNRWVRLALLVPVLLSYGCATAPPEEPDNICEIFREKEDWHDASVSASKRWGGPVHLPMAIMYQESAFREDARPPMRYFLGFIPTGRGSSAYGYSQAQTPAWSDYQRESGNSWADRDDFEDAVDFVQWYMDKTSRINGVSKHDAFAQYLNYHEGWGGYRRGSYRSKQWLVGVARKVERRSNMYRSQYASCKEEFESGWFWGLFD